MSLRIVYGRAGSGKTHALMNTAASIIETGGKNIIFIVPEQYSLQTERKIAASFSSAKSAEALSFERLSYRVFSHVGPVYARYLDDSAKQILMQKALLAVKNKLTVLASAAETEGFSSVMLNTVKELNHQGITPEALFLAADHAAPPLKLKLIDIAAIFQKYTSLFEYPNANEEDNLTILLEKIRTHDLFRNYNIILDSFSRFSANQFAVIEELLARCKTVTIALTADDLAPPSDAADVFFSAKRTANDLFDAARRTGAEVLPNIYLKDCRRFSENPELLHLEASFFKYPAKKYAEPTQSISIFKADNCYGEVESAAVKILRLCRTEGLRFRDITVTTRALDTYAPLIQSVFSDHGILFGMDMKTTALNHALANSVMSLFDIIIHGFPYEAIFTWLKSDYCPANDEDIFLLENYVLARGNSAKIWTEDTLTYAPEGFDDEALARLNNVKNTVIAPIVSFADKFSGRKTVAEISQAFAEFLYESGANAAAAEKIKQYRTNGETGKTGVGKSDAEAAAWNAIMHTLDDMAAFLGEEYITFEKYRSIFISGLSGTEIGQIPPTIDEVRITGVERLGNQETKCVIFLGTTNGVFPACYTNEGLLSDNDRDALANSELLLTDSSAAKQASENQVIYSAITGADRLFFFYPIADNDGAALYPSTIIERLKDIFPHITIEDNIFQNENSAPQFEAPQPAFNKMLFDREIYAEVEAWFSERQPKRLADATRAMKYTNIPQQPLSPSTVRALYGDVPKGSISRAEQFNRCNYSYFLKYGLFAEERKIHTLNVADEGTIMHEVIELYSKQAGESGWQDMTEQRCREAVGGIVNDVLERSLTDTYTQSPKFSYLARRVEKIMSATAWQITKYYQKTPFVPLGYELSFDKNGDFPPIEVDVNGTTILLRGKVDRADVWRTPDGSFVSITDYKSGGKNIDYSELQCGIRIQLPIYIKSVCDALSKLGGTQAIPAAMLYYKFDSPIISADANISDEEIREAVQKKLKMRGITLENTVINENVNTAFAVKSTATGKQIDKLCSHAFKQLKSAFSGILNGNISIRPVRASGKTACDWCPYKAVCGFDPARDDNNYHSIRKITGEEFFEYGTELD